jgi:hypothetical protein
VLLGVDPLRLASFGTDGTDDSMAKTLLSCDVRAFKGVQEIIYSTCDLPASESEVSAFAMFDKPM